MDWRRGRLARYVEDETVFTERMEWIEEWGEWRGEEEREGVLG